jgi:kynurenine 3-monooxygenase
MVTFRPDISYAVARAKAERQAAILSAVGWAAGATTAMGIVGGLAWIAHTLGWVSARSRR